MVNIILGLTIIKNMAKLIIEFTQVTWLNNYQQLSSHDLQKVIQNYHGRFSLAVIMQIVKLEKC